jgi:hypothetical protein
MAYRFLRSNILHNLKRALLGAALAAVLTAAVAPTVQAQAVAAGFRDFSYGPTVNTPTSKKPQSKLWWNDGVWWGSLYSVSAGAYCIHRLDAASQTWINTGTVIDTRPDSHMDVLWDGQHLYIVSGGSSTSGLLTRYTYDPISRQYTLDAGFPVTARSGGAETITIAKDSTGRLWVTFTQGGKLWVNRSTGGDTVWGAQFVPAVAGTTVAADDISADIAFQGNRIGVMWSNQVDRKFYFAVHRDGDPDTAWQPVETALPGPGQDPSWKWADDHLNLKAASDGRILAAVKTSLSDMPGPDPNAPLTMLLVRSAAGAWTSYPFGRIKDNHSRPVALIDQEHSFVYMLATSPDVPGGVVYYKTTPLGAIHFPVGIGTPFIQSASDTAVNNATSTKQNLNGLTGLVALAGDDNTRTYLHNELSLANLGPLPAEADSYVRDGASADTNFGTAKTLFVKTNTNPGFNRDTYFLFNVTGLIGTVTSGKLRFYAALTDTSSLSTTVYTVPDTTWTETGLTWNNRPAPGDAIGGTTVAGTAYAWYEVDVTSALRAALSAGDNLVSFMLHNGSAASSSVIQIASRESANAPRLTVTTDASSTVPGPPSELSAAIVSGTQIALNWTDNATNEDGFKIERSTDGVAFTQLTTVGPNATGYPDNGLAIGTTYYYRVRAFNTVGNSTYSNTASATTPSNPPAAPTGLAATAAASDAIALSWTDNANNEDGFQVERSTDGVTFAPVATTAANTASWADSGLAPVTASTYRVRAFNINGSSGYSNAATAKTAAGAYLGASADTYVRDGSFADSNFGPAKLLFAKSSNTAGVNRDSYFKFDLSGQTRTIVGARLRIWSSLSAAGALSASAYGVPDISWVETGMTWNNRPTIGGILGGTTVVDTVAAWYELDVTGHVLAELDAGRPIVSLALHNPVTASGTYIQLNSREATSNPPQLVVTYAPAAPTSLKATTVSSTRISLAWADGGPDEDGFKIERFTAGGAFTQVATVGPNTTSWVDTGLTAGKTYYYRVRSFNAVADSAYSKAASAATLSEVALTTIADAYVRDGSYAAMNFGTEKTLYAKLNATSGYNRDSYFKFNLASMASGVYSARLRFFASLSAAGTLGTSAYGVADTTWTETGLTWNNRPALGGRLGDAAVTDTTYAWYEIDVTGYVRSELAAGRTTIGLALHNLTTTPSPVVQINSRESAANWPQLIVSH